jgi:hypothetical protein
MKKQISIDSNDDVVIKRIIIKNLETKKMERKFLSERGKEIEKPEAKNLDEIPRTQRASDKFLYYTTMRNTIENDKINYNDHHNVDIGGNDEDKNKTLSHINHIQNDHVLSDENLNLNFNFLLPETQIENNITLYTDMDTDNTSKQISNPRKFVKDYNYYIHCAKCLLIVAGESKIIY